MCKTEISERTLFSFRAGRLTPDSRDDEARERAVMVKNAQALLCALNG